MTDRPTDEQIQAIIDWPVPLGRMTAPLLAREVKASRKLAADLLALVDNALAGSCPHVHREQLMVEMRRRLVESCNADT